MQWSGVGEEIRLRADREAHIISALNHPGICTLHDMYWDRTTPILVMECLQGETLDQRLTRSRLTQEAFRTIGLQICEALTYAHERRVLHGDLKPANIMLTERGAVLLDFGLSRSIGEPAVGAKEDGQAASHAFPRGWVAGTPAYMSPEQIRGEQLDARSDVFSLGCVLHKMASGRGPFHRNSTEDTFQAILKAAPEPPPAQLAGVPRRVRSLIAKCLRLEPADRFQSVAEVTKSLRRATSSRVRARLTVAGVVLLVAAMGSAVWFGTRREDPPLVARQFTFDDGQADDPAFSPDGEMLAFGSDRGGKNHESIWIQQVDGSRPVQLTDGEYDEVVPAFSADGTTIAFTSFRPDGPSIYVVPATGGMPQLLAKGGRFARYSPDGKWIAFIKPINFSHAELVVMPASGGTPRKIAKVNPTSAPVWSSDSSAVISAGYSGASLSLAYLDAQLFDWFAVPVDGRPAMPLKIRRVFSGEPNEALPVAWQGERLICLTWVGGSSSLWELRVRREQAWHLESKPKLLRADVKPSGLASLVGRRLAFTAGDWHRSVGMLRLDPNAPKSLAHLERAPGMMNAQLWDTSPDGRELAYFRYPDQLGSYLRNLGTGEERRLEVPGKSIIASYLSKRPKMLVVAGSPSASYRDSTTYLMDTVGGKRDILCTGCDSPQSSPDGRWIFVKRFDDPQSILLTSSGERYLDVLDDSQNVQSVRFSADGKWIAFRYSKDQRNGRLYAAPFRGATPVPKADWVLLTRDEGEYGRPGWSPDGRVVYYSSKQDGYRCLYARRLDVSKKQALGEPIAIYHAHGTPSIPDDYDALSVARDKLVFEIGDGRTNIWLAELPPE